MALGCSQSPSAGSARSARSASAFLDGAPRPASVEVLHRPRFQKPTQITQITQARYARSQITQMDSLCRGCDRTARAVASFVLCFAASRRRGKGLPASQHQRGSSFAEQNGPRKFLKNRKKATGCLTTSSAHLALFGRQRVVIPVTSVVRNTKTDRARAIADDGIARACVELGVSEGGGMRRGRRTHRAPHRRSSPENPAPA